MCFELATQIVERIRDFIAITDEVQCLRCFEDRDLNGFVDVTENPRGAAALETALVGAEDTAFAGDS